ncbi:ABC transporter substrate-binding protein [Meiothermus ruber]|jgi:iron complex transport system substrate-binding protein|uniref:Periplasmic binding protein n=1 Tax=Meiothermus ruber (strain ATCC 35948 / DSM 1279 / VKM B-1258 / 21) TaxID=504728 RepID=A0A806CSJ5_MEIRD|nr:iron-siderophore ABC transporter substrate-binding protein [Meiothermus ruber]ADD29172.1 periplasmic binding protein [Meiothermus ruber DSM 1279]MCL6528495.1 iron-siderophore ABC transporter substrate-binding protein [Meiothermus ruber]MCX7783855.1 iron-siderophore ABC transporter substrate-binding protein [Meiothermus sp.]GAO76092.1 periplasmic binding protein [Meiothermus ruber H328]
MKRLISGFLFILASLTAAQACTGRLVQHALGETCVVGTPKRVVALEWTYAEYLLALGLQPAGMADIRGYHEWVKIPVALDRSVPDVGTRQQPSLERIAAIKPDLILAPSFRITQTYGRLSQIAPTIAFNPFPEDGSSQFARVLQDFQTVAELVGKGDQGRRVRVQMEARFAQARQLLQQAKRSGESFVLVQAFTSQNVGTMRLFTRNSIASEILERIGLKNAWSDRPQLYGYSTLGLEGLASIRADNFFYIVQDDDNVFLNPSVEPLWKNLEPVKNNRAYRLSGQTWTFGGPLSAETLVNAVITAMLRR